MSPGYSPEQIAQIVAEWGLLKRENAALKQALSGDERMYEKRGAIPPPPACTPECWRDTNTLLVWHQKGCPTWPEGGDCRCAAMEHGGSTQQCIQAATYRITKASPMGDVQFLMCEWHREMSGPHEREQSIA